MKYNLVFFAYEYPLLEPLQIWEGLSIASITDIAAMKLSAITSRSTLKDYVDLYTILQYQTLPTLLEAALRKFPNLNRNLILKSLVYFVDIHPEPMQFMPGYEVDQPRLKHF